ncbi:MAG: hypothetical protein ABIG28_00935 [archaeon]
MKKSTSTILLVFIMLIISTGSVSANIFEDVADFFKNIFSGKLFSPDCEDSDITAEYPDGKNPFTAGSVTEGGVPYLDFCDTPTAVKEYYCTVNDALWRTTIPCPELCQDGACISTQQCTETCQSLNFECGLQSVCGTQTDCGTCSDPEEICQSGQCVVLCGNGVLDQGEECDDSNRLDGDGCDSMCELENACFYELRIDDSAEVDGISITLQTIDPSGTIALKVGTRPGVVPSSSTETINDLTITNIKAVWAPDERDMSTKISVLGEDCGETISTHCSDNTLDGDCSLTRPLYCNNTVLTENCFLCGCPSDETCNITISKCYTPSTPIKTCTDSTQYASCSTTKPLYCTSQGNLELNCVLCRCPSNQICNVTTKDCEETTAPTQPCNDGTPYEECSLTKPLYCNSTSSLEIDCIKCSCPSGFLCNIATKECEKDFFVFVIRCNENGEKTIELLGVKKDSSVIQDGASTGGSIMKIIDAEGKILFSKELGSDCKEETQIITPYFPNAETLELYNEQDNLVQSLQLNPETQKKISSFMVLSIIGGMFIFFALLFAIYYLILKDKFL